uniref:Putative secreted protein n=1 Tax=Anopheles triannulatus TaxID=58253 RepID=A0A2M4B244_9DIPT
MVVQMDSMPSLSPLPVPLLMLVVLLLVEGTPPEVLEHLGVHCDGGIGGHDASRPVFSAVPDDGDDGGNHGRRPYVMQQKGEPLGPVVPKPGLRSAHEYQGAPVKPRTRMMMSRMRSWSWTKS